MALKVLHALDAAKTQWYHFRAIIIAGMGFFTDAYDLFCIPPVTKLLGRLYYYDPGSDQPGSLALPVNAVVNGIALCGALVGQLFFGWLGDRMGRKKVYGMTLTLMMVGSIASAFSFGSSAKAVMTSLCFFRFWLGFGIGGDYPLSATIMSEYANKKTRGSFIAAVFAMQGFGILAASAVTLTVSAAFHGAYPTPPFQQHLTFDPSTPRQADYVWRIILLLGAAPAALTYYWRMQMPETARYTALVAGNTEQAAVDMSKVLRVRIEEDHTNADMIPGPNASYGLFSKEFARQHGRHLLGTTVTWFLLDIAFYSSNLYQSQMYTAVEKLPAPRDISALEEVLQMARLQSIVALCSTMPGYLFTVALIDRIGRFRIQLLGFIFMTAFIFVLAIPREHYWREHNEGFVAVYSLTFFFSNFGPNCTTFIIPAELFPARLRSTCHGISAAAGKAGAIIGAFGFLYAGHRIGASKTLIILGITCCLGIFFTYYFTPETNGRSLEENEEEIVESETRRSNGHESEEAWRRDQEHVEVIWS